ncbi:hypothetical protein DERF_011483 [Dermatophagoides farinae]|uniref:Uncharacterized protein n=1 Tax=Dermatophagoides farinae TaxID=6954 RepID=A0A922HSA2_DERFA|nr:hypothetical protein DERF_011483 [Dermatophagoides farinae]
MNFPSRSFTVSLILMPYCAGITLLVISRLVSSASSLPVIVTTVFKHGSLLGDVIFCSRKVNVF